MNYEQATDMWLKRCANIPIKWKMVEGHQFICSIDKSYPARMMMKLKRLKFMGKKKMNIKPEQLKALAEMMNYECSVKPRNIDGTISDAVFLYVGEVWYNPLTNDSQAMELMEKLLDADFNISKDLDDNEYGVWLDTEGTSLVTVYRAKTINEAITLAAIAMEEGKSER